MKIRGTEKALKLRFILDRQSIELFVNQGRHVSTTAICTPQEAERIGISMRHKYKSKYPDVRNPIINIKISDFRGKASWNLRFFIIMEQGVFYAFSNSPPVWFRRQVPYPRHKNSSLTRSNGSLRLLEGNADLIFPDLLDGGWLLRLA